MQILSARLGRLPKDIVKLDANENPYGPPPEVKFLWTIHEWQMLTLLKDTCSMRFECFFWRDMQVSIFDDAHWEQLCGTWNSTMQSYFRMSAGSRGSWQYGISKYIPRSRKPEVTDDAGKRHRVRGRTHFGWMWSRWTHWPYHAVMGSTTS